MSATLDLLLKLDPKAIKKPQKQVEIKRLSNLSGDKAIFTCEAITADKFAGIQEQAVSIQNGKLESIDTNEIQIFTILEGIKDPNLRSKELQEKFSVPSPKDLVKKLLLPGEITQIYNVISDLSGFGGDSVEEIKNS